jgi:hypothetical protein
MDFDDLYSKCVQVFKIAKFHNLVLKMAKSWFGLTTVNFFGYELCHGSYGLSKERIAEIQVIPLPSSLQQAQRMHGALVFFKPFIPRFSDKLAHLYEMTQKTFSCVDS